MINPCSFKESDIPNLNFSFKEISEYVILSEDFIRRNKDYLDWGRICDHQILSESFIIEHNLYVDWFNLSRSQKLSEKFIIENQSLIWWRHIFEHQKLSEDFWLNNKDKPCSLYILKNNCIKQYSLSTQRLLLAEYLGYFNMPYVKRYLTPYMIEELDKHQFLL